MLSSIDCKTGVERIYSIDGKQCTLMAKLHHEAPQDSNNSTTTTTNEIEDEYKEGCPF